MGRPFSSIGSLIGLTAALIASAAAGAGPIDDLQLLREGGCGGLVPYTSPLKRSVQLDGAAAAWSRGATFKTALQVSGYPVQISTGLHVHASDANLIAELRNSCRKIADASLHDVGLYTQGRDNWIVLGSTGRTDRELSAPLEAVAPGAPQPAAVSFKSRAAPEKPRPALQASLQAQRILILINAARAHATACGNHTFAPAPPVSLSSTLAGVALGHAVDMADHNYFEHKDLLGRSPADRVRAVGYREKLVGENIAYGVENADEAVRGWLDSPGHCENIMDPRFAEMGVGFAQGRRPHGLYWVQLFAQPKA